MSAQQRLLSCLFVAHLSALFITAIPGLADFGEGVIARGDQPVTRLTGAMDAAASQLVWVHRVASSLIQPLAGPAYAYVRTTAQFQTWNMFSNPSREYSSARMGYRLRLADGTIRTEFEPIFPSGRTGVLKVASAYFDSYMDKVMSNAGETYRTLQSQARADGKKLPTDQMVRSLLPYTTYYGHRRVQAGLPEGAQLLAVEFWWGTTPAPPPPSGSRIVLTSNAPVAIRWRRWGVQDWQ